jgi:hypothetical protein
MHGNNPVHALSRIAELLQGCEARWVVGGSTGLAMRGAVLETAPRDLDIYADEDDIPALHNSLRSYVVDSPTVSETDRYRSILSHYSVGGTVAELVGGFRIAALNSEYKTEVSNVLHAGGDRMETRGHPYTLVPLGHELIFNLLRERTDRVSLVGAMIARDPGRHMPILLKLLERNRITSEMRSKALAIVQEPQGDPSTRKDDSL